MSHLLQPKVEAEGGLRRRRDLGGTAPSWAEFLICIACALPVAAGDLIHADLGALGSVSCRMD